MAELYARRFLRVVEREIALANITAHDLVLHVGCGPLPYTAIHTFRLTGARVIAVDRDARAVTRARSCLRRLGLGPEVQVIHCDGTGDIPAGFTVAMVALHAEPKAAIAANLLARAGPGTRLVFRQTRPSFASQYDDLPPILVPSGRTRHGRPTLDASILLTQPGGGA